MAVFDGQFDVMVLRFESILKANWVAVGMAEGVVDQRM